MLPEKVKRFFIFDFFTDVMHKLMTNVAKLNEKIVADETRASREGGKFPTTRALSKM